MFFVGVAELTHYVLSTLSGQINVIVQYRYTVFKLLFPPVMLMPSSLCGAKNIIGTLKKGVSECEKCFLPFQYCRPQTDPLSRDYFVLSSLVRRYTTRQMDFIVTLLSLASKLAS